MKKGAKWQLFIPAELAYGADGRPPAIGPNEVLVFDVELLDITAGN
jgi:FKBP-type peptidyl-prolyl cis-trans isomerase FklB